MVSVQKILNDVQHVADDTDSIHQTHLKILGFLCFPTRGSCNIIQHSMVSMFPL